MPGINDMDRKGNVRGILDGNSERIVSGALEHSEISAIRASGVWLISG